MATRISKAVTFTIPPAMAEEMEFLAREEKRSKSELFREMFRLYRLFREQKRREDEDRLGQLVHMALVSVSNTPTTTAELEREAEELGSYGAERAKALGITREEEVSEILYAGRRRQ